MTTLLLSLNAGADEDGEFFGVMQPGASGGGGCVSIGVVLPGGLVAGGRWGPRELSCEIGSAL